MLTPYAVRIPVTEFKTSELSAPLQKDIAQRLVCLATGFPEGAHIQTLPWTCRADFPEATDDTPFVIHVADPGDRDESTKVFRVATPADFDAYALLLKIAKL